MKTKMKLAHEYMQNTLNLLRKHNIPYDFESLIEESYEYAEAMIAEEDKRSKAEAEQKRKEMREMLTAPNTFVEREGQHFDDVNWQPDWSEAPEWAKWWAMDRDGESYYFKCKPEMKLVTWVPLDNEVIATHSNYRGYWKESLRERTE